MNLIKSKILRYICLFVLLFSLSGCPYNPHKILFYENKKLKEYIVIYYESDDFYINIGGSSYFNHHTSRNYSVLQNVEKSIAYDIDLNFYIKYDSQKIDLSFHPKSIQIFFPDIELKPNLEKQKSSYNEEAFSFVGSYETMIKYSDLDTRKCANDGYNIKIILNDWLQNDGVSVFTDTLYACDKKINHLRMKSREIIYIE